MSKLDTHSTPGDMAITTPLWSLFAKSWQTLAGAPAEDFSFIPEKTPLATFNETAAMLLVYYVTILGGHELMRERPAFQLKTPFMIHNLFLTILSGGLLVLFLEQLVPTVWQQGIYSSVCDGSAGWTKPLTLLYYVSDTPLLIELVLMSTKSSTTSPNTSSSSTLYFSY